MLCLKFMLQKTFRTKQIFSCQRKKHADLDNCSVQDRGTFCLLITLVCEVMSKLHNHGENHSLCPLMGHIRDLVKISILWVYCKHSLLLEIKERGRNCAQQGCGCNLQPDPRKTFSGLSRLFYILHIQDPFLTSNWNPNFLSMSAASKHSNSSNLTVYCQVSCHELRLVVRVIRQSP